MPGELRLTGDSLFVFLLFRKNRAVRFRKKIFNCAEKKQVKPRDQTVWGSIHTTGKRCIKGSIGKCFPFVSRLISFYQWIYERPKTEPLLLKTDLRQ